MSARAGAAPGGGQLRPIGVVRSAHRSRRKARRQGAEGAPDAWIEVHPWAAKGLRGIAAGDEVIVITWLHQVRRDVLRVHPRSDRRNPLMTWGAPRISNELAKLGIEVAVSTVAKYMRRRRKPLSPTWRAFLENHFKDLVALDFFVVPTATFGVLFGLVVLPHHRRRVVHFNVTAHPTAEWTARQVLQAFPEDTAPRFLVRDRDRIYGERFRRAIDVLGIQEVVTAARSPWQNPYAERLIGSLRRECLDHVIVLDEMHLLRILATYFKNYNTTRCHLSLAGDAPEPRRVQGTELGEVVELPEVGGIHHRYERAAA